MADIVLNIAKDFSRCPGARYPDEGNFSGEEFRQNYLLPMLLQAVRDKIKLIVVLDGSAGYSTSFLEEAFGGLIRTERMDLKLIMDTMRLISNEDPSYVDDIYTYLQHAAKNS